MEGNLRWLQNHFPPLSAASVFVALGFNRFALTNVLALVTLKEDFNWMWASYRMMYDTNHTCAPTRAATQYTWGWFEKDYFLRATWEQSRHRPLCKNSQEALLLSHHTIFDWLEAKQQKKQQREGCFQRGEAERAGEGRISKGKDKLGFAMQ